MHADEVATSSQLKKRKISSYLNSTPKRAVEVHVLCSLVLEKSAYRVCVNFCQVTGKLTLNL